jgi:2-polyprenyl-3-methyl-5-hydroxy-6-metoxy-1,4-benzoquinol methylase
MTWARRRAIDVHDETAAYFLAEYSSENIYDSPFRYGRCLIDALWWKTVAELGPRAHCLDIGCGIGAYMTRLIEAGFRTRGIEPSMANMLTGSCQPFRPTSPNTRPVGSASMAFRS